jgi:hypothetical protein
MGHGLAGQVAEESAISPSARARATTSLPDSERRPASPQAAWSPRALLAHAASCGCNGRCPACRAAKALRTSAGGLRPSLVPVGRAVESPPGVDDEGTVRAAPTAEAAPRDDDATIVCDGRGDYRVSPGWSASATCGVGDCVRGHEESHARDWRARWPNGCKNADGTPKPDGADIPLGGPGYAAFLRASECRAYTGEVPCGEGLLAAATDACKPTVTSQLSTWRSRKASYCS